MDSSREIDLYWHKIRNTLDELVGCLDGLDSDSLNWKPLDDANSLYALAIHTMYNPRHNLLNVLCGLPVTRDRDAEFMVRGDSAVEIEARWVEIKDQNSDATKELPPTELDRERDYPPGAGASPAASCCSSSPATLPSTTDKRNSPETC